MIIYSYRFKYVIKCICLVYVFSLSCSHNEKKYSPENYYSADVIDSLMVDIVTYIGKKPKNADHITKYDPEYRNFYTEMSRDFNMRKLFIAEDGTHYFYIIRPARHPLGNRRAIGGRFLLDEYFQIRDFEEIFVTRVSDEENLNATGIQLFNELVRYGDTGSYLFNREIIEWPDDRCKYDNEKKEWRYDVE